MILVAAFLKIAAQIGMVVDLAIENEQDIAATASMHRLVTGGRKIDDRQSPEAKRASTVIKLFRSFVVRPAVHHCVTHSLNERQFHVSIARSVLPNARDTAHIS